MMIIWSLIKFAMYGEKEEEKFIEEMRSRFKIHINR